MDWSIRRYFVVSLPLYPTGRYDYYTQLIKSQTSVKLHPPTYPPHEAGSGINFTNKFSDEYCSRGYYHYVASVRGSDYNLLLYTFNIIARECAEHGWRFMWREIYPKCGGRQ